jgi:hypothetical protein
MDYLSNVYKNLENADRSQGVLTSHPGVNRRADVLQRRRTSETKRGA